MSMFDFLKIAIKKPPKKKPGPPKAPQNRVQIDSKSFTLGAITPSGLVITGFDGSLVKGQNARIGVSIDDQFAKFAFETTVLVIDVTGDKMTAQFGLITPDTETLLRKYVQLRKQKAGK